MESDDIWDLPQFKHEPVHPAREGVMGEEVFYAAWKKYMAADTTGDHPFNHKLMHVMSDYGYPLTERCAQVAATVIVWLGCNIGRAMREEGEKLSTNILRRETAYLQAWASHNVRQNAGYRPLERFLTPHGQEIVRESITAQDYEAAEQVMRWLGSDSGRKFLKACEDEIKRQESVISFERHLKMNLQLKPEQVPHMLKMAAAYNPNPVQFVR